MIHQAKAKVALAAVGAAGLLAVAACAPDSSGSGGSSADYPTRAIEYVVPFDPGGGTDLVARAVAQELSDRLGVPVNVVNQSAANGVGGTKNVLDAAPDGYTLLADGAATSSLQALNPDLPFDWEDRTFIARYAAGPHAFAVGSDAPWKSLDEVIAAAAEDPGSFSISWLGGSTTTDFAMKQFLAEAGISLDEVKKVPYQGSGPAVQAAASGDVDLAAASVADTFPLVSSGDLRVLATTGQEAFPELPEVPTTADIGLEGLDMQFWLGMSGPPDMPSEVVDVLQTELQEIVEDEAFLKRLDAMAATPAYLGAEEQKEFVHDQVDTFETLTETLEGR